MKGFEHIIAGARGLSPVALAEAVLVSDMIPEDVEIEIEIEAGVEVVEVRDVRLPNRPRFPVATAHEIGLVDQAERDSVIADAHRATMDRIQSTLTAAAGRRHNLDEAELERLREAAGDPERFSKIAAEHHLRFWITPPNWTWPVDSVSAVLASPSTTPAQLQVLGREWCYQVRLALEQDMERAWHRGLWWFKGDDVDPADPDAGGL